MNFPNLEELYTLHTREGYAAREALRTWAEHTANKRLATEIVHKVNRASVDAFRNRHAHLHEKDTGEHAAVRGEA
jgi:hypothetical protein